MTDLRKTYLRAAELLGAEADDSTITKTALDSDYIIVLFQVCHHNTIWMTLTTNTWKGGAGTPNEEVAKETIKCGASDKVITNRINKLLKAYKEKKGENNV